MTLPSYLKPIVSHLLVFGLAYGICKGWGADGNENKPPESVRSRSSNRSGAAASGSDGPELLAEFRRDIASKQSRYEALKQSLAPAADRRSAALDAWEQYRTSKDRPNEDLAELFAMAQVRMLQWLNESPDEMMAYLKREEEQKEDEIFKQELVSILGINVFHDAIREQGVIHSLSWVSSYPTLTRQLLQILPEEMKQGGGLALFIKLEDALVQSDIPSAVLDQIIQNNDLLTNIGASIKFSEKEKLLEYLMVRDDPGRNLSRSLLLGFIQSSDAAATWIYDMMERGQLPEELAKGIRGGLGNSVLMQPRMDLEKRIAARRFTPGNERKSRDAIVGELVSGDVNRLLNQGRDWRFEFRHGVATLDDILSAVDSELIIPKEGEAAARIALYRTLSEENPKQALTLLDMLPEEKRREVMFSNTWESYGSINPDDILRFVQSLPEPVTEKEKTDRMKGWDWKARGHLLRYGEDYIEWAAALPPSPDKYAIINSVIWATRERNPEKAEELNQRFYPKEP
jgi:hypothetical protein